MLTRRVQLLAASALVFVAATARSTAQDAPAEAAPIPVAALERATPVDFEKEVLPLFTANCLACHNRTKAKADLVLETPADLLKGGESGPAVVPKDGAGSLLLKLAAHQLEPVMPPKGNKAAAADFTPEQLGLLKLWIDQGATGTVSGATSLRWQAVPATLGPIYGVAVTGDGQYAACSRGNRIFVYHLGSNQLIAQLIDAALQPPSGDTTATVPAAHRDLVQALAFSPDGAVLASGGYREVKLWRRPRDVRRFSVASAAGGAVRAAAASADGKRFAAAGDDAIVRVWDATRPEAAVELPGHAAAVNCLKFSPDGSKLASGSADKTLRVWSLADNRPFALTTTPAEVTSATWVAAGKQLAAGGADGVIRVWALPEMPGSEMAAVKEMKGHEGPVASLDTVSGVNHVLSGGADGAVRQWDVDAAAVVRQMAHGGAVTAVAVRGDGQRFASAGLNNLAKLWDAEGKQLAELKGDRSAQARARERERDVAFMASEVAYHKGNVQNAEKQHAEQTERVKKAVLAVIEAEKPLPEKQKAVADATAAKAAAENEKQPADKIEAATKALAAAQAELTKSASAKAAADDELRLAIKSAHQAAEGSTIAQGGSQAAEAEHKRVEAELPPLKAAAAESEKPVRAVVFSADNLLLATAGDDGQVRTYAAETGAAVETYTGHQGPALALAILPGGVVLSGGADGAAHGWELSPPWKLERTLGNGGPDSPLADRVNALDFSPDGRLLVTGGGVPSREGELALWDVGAGALVRRFERVHSDTVLGVDFSADGRFIASGGADRFMKVLDAASGAVVKSFEGHTGHVMGVAWKRDGRTLASCAADNSVKFWDFAGGEQRKAVQGFNKEVTSVRFVGDGDELVATAGDGKVRIVKPDGSDVRALPGATDFVYAASSARDGKTVAAGGEDGTLRVWDATSGQPVVTFPPPYTVPEN